MALFPGDAIGQSNRCQCSTDKYPLHCAVNAYACKPEFVQAYIDSGYRVNDVDDKGNTPLHHLMMYTGKRAEKVYHILMAAGADPNIKNEAGYTVFDLALRNHQLYVVDQLRAAKQTPSKMVEHPYYQALESNDEQQVRRIKRYVRNEAWDTEWWLPLGVSYDFARRPVLAIETGVFNYTDDILTSHASRGVYLGAIAELDHQKKYGFSVNPFYCHRIFYGGVRWQQYLGEDPLTILEPQAGLTFGSLITVYYSRRFVINEASDYTNLNNLGVRLTWFRVTTLFESKKRKVYAENALLY